MPFAKKVLLVLAGVLLLLALAFFTTGIPLTLSPFRGQIETALGEALWHEVRIEGAIGTTLQLKPEIRLEGLAIENPPDWSGDFDRVLHLESLRARLFIARLLNREIMIPEIRIKGLTVTVEEDENGRSNWRPPEEGLLDGAEDTGTRKKPYRLIAIDRIDIDDVFISHQVEEHSESGVLTLKSLTGSMEEGQPMNFVASGTFRDEPFTIDARSGALDNLLDASIEWPLEFSLSYLGVALECLGVRIQGDKEGHIDFHLKIDDYAKLEEVLQTQFPSIGPLDVRGRLHDAGGGMLVQDLKGTLGVTSLLGDLAIDRRGSVPNVTGELNFGTVDPQLLLARKESKEADAGTGGGLPAKVFLPITGEIRLTIEEVINPKTTIRDVDFNLELEQEQIEGTLDVAFAGVPLEGPVAAGLLDDGSRGFVADLAARDDKIGGLVEFYTGAKGITGPFEFLRFHMFGREKTLEHAIIRRTVQFVIKNAELEVEREDGPLRVHIDDLDMTRMDGFPVTRTIAGRFKDLPFEAVVVHLEPKKARPGQQPFVDLTGTIAGAEVSLKGDLRRAPEDPVLPLAFTASGEDLSGFAAIAGFKPDARLPFAASGTAYLGDEAMRFESLDVKAGTTTLKGDFAKTSSDETTHFTANLDIGTVIPAEISSLFPEKKEEPAPEKESLLDVQLLPEEFNLPDADFDISVDRVVLEGRELNGLALAGQVRGGTLEKTGFTLTIGESPVAGNVAFDFTDESPWLNLDVSFVDVDVGAALENLDLVRGLESSAGKLRFDTTIRGGTIREILQQSDLRSEWEEALWILKDKNTGARLPIEVAHGSAESIRGSDLVLDIDGRLQGLPLEIEIVSNGLEAFADSHQDINFEFVALIVGTEIDMAGNIDLPLDETDLDVNLTVKSDRLDRLDQLLGVDLPPIGPYSMSGAFSFDEKGYAFRNFNLEVGQSDLQGSLSLNTSVKPTRIDVDFETDTIQIDDFLVEGWPVKEPNQDKPEAAPEAEPDVIDSYEEADKAVWDLLSPEVLNSLDAVISLEIREVLLGDDLLGHGSIHGQLIGGQITLDRLHIDTPGGEVSGSFTFHPGPRDLDMTFDLVADDFDYGILARRIDPESTVAGIIDVDFNLQGTGMPLGSRLLTHGNGYLNLEVWPEDISADVFDLWATNLIFALLPKVDPSRKSELNCIVARFKVDEGHLTPELLVIDTTNVRAFANCDIDFREGRLTARVEPRAKRPQFFNLGFPVTVSGGLDEPELALGDLGALGVPAHLFGNTVFFPAKFLLDPRLRRDGRDLQMTTSAADSAGAATPVIVQVKPSADVAPSETPVTEEERPQRQRRARTFGKKR